MLRLLSVRTWLICNHHLWLVTSLRQGKCPALTELRVTYNKKERVCSNDNNFTKVDGIFTDGHPQIIGGLRQTNIDTTGGNLQPARPEKVYNFRQIDGQKSRLVSQWHQRKSIPIVGRATNLYHKYEKSERLKNKYIWMWKNLFSAPTFHLPVF